MGDVYAAHDDDLRRTVAIKILNPERSGGAAIEWLMEEARAASVLNHPNILTVYEVIRVGGEVGIVMEMVEGVALRALCDHPSAVAQVTAVGRQAARALAAAHAAGLIHRDIKPENIMIRTDGIVKIVDFGMAAKIDGTTSPSDVPIGTYRYTSPERLGGGAASEASDVFSLGLVLYEMLTGRHPFHSASPVETVYGIELRDPPPVGGDRKGVPPELERLLFGMMDKNPVKRPSSTQVALELERIEEGMKAPVGNFQWIWMAPAAIAAAALLYFLISGKPSVGPVQMVDTRIDFGSGKDLQEEGFALSPDGQTLLFRANNKLNYLKMGGGGAAVEWKGSEYGLYPFWSPDGKQAGYLQDGKLWRREFPDGAPKPICEAADPVSASWGRRGTIVFSVARGSIRKVAAEGGESVAATPWRDSESYQAAPAFLPDGVRFLYHAAGPGDKGQVMLASADGGRPPVALLQASSGAVFLPHPHERAGMLVYALAGQVLAQPFDPVAAVLKGEPKVISERAREMRKRLIPAAVSATGALAYAEAEDKTDQAKIFSRDGRLLSRFAARREYVRAIPSPDERLVSLVTRDARTGMLSAGVFDRGSGQSTLLGSIAEMVWSADGKQIVYRQESDRPLRIMRWPTDGAPAEVDPPTPGDWPLDWSHDGQSLLLLRENPVTGRDIWETRLDSSAPPRPIANGPGRENQARFSPNDRFIAYQSEDSGPSEVFVVARPPDGRKWKVSEGGGQEPRWRSDGKELFYLSIDYALWSVKVDTTGRDLKFERPVKLFGGRSSEPSLLVWHADPLAGGQQFLILTGNLTAPPSPLRLRLNWWAAANR